MYVDWGFLQEITDADALFQEELVREFCGQAEMLGERIRAAADTRDIESLRRAAHSLKGSAASVGATILAEEATALDELATVGDLSGAVERLEPFFQSLDGTLAEMNAWINEAA